MKLTIELVPKTSWYSNVRSNVSKQEWDNIKKHCYKKAGYKCEICGGVGEKWPVECHEIWVYDDKNHIQVLNGFIALCPNCHKVKHVGLAQINGEIDIVINQLMNVNGWDYGKVVGYIKESFDIWKERCKYQWELDLNYLDGYMDNIGLNTSNVIKPVHKKLKWFFHDEHQIFFPEFEGTNFGSEEGFVWEIGDYVKGGIGELKELLRNIDHYLKDNPDLEKMINEDEIEQL